MGALVTITPGAQFEVLTRKDVDASLRQHADDQLRAEVRGISGPDLFLNLAMIQQITNSPIGSAPAANVVSLPGTPPFTPGNGMVWAVMNVGWELTGASNIRIYKGAPPGINNTPAGIGRLVYSNLNTPTVSNAPFSKGQFKVRSGEQITFLTVTATIFVLSLFFSLIEVPAEREGELYI